MPGIGTTLNNFVRTIVQKIFSLNTCALRIPRFYATVGTYPLDGVGYHIYTTQQSVDPNEVIAGLRSNLVGLWSNGIVAGESFRFPNQSPNKDIWISEYGWGSLNVGLDGQASNLAVALEVFSDDQLHVGSSMWFSLQDWEGEQGWGLLTADFSEKPSFATFQAKASAH